MRDLVFKNLTSKDRSRKVFLAKETIDEDGIHTRIQKHLIYNVEELSKDQPKDRKIESELFITKEKKSKSKSESFFIKMKSGMYANSNDRLFFINFLQSLRIDLSPTNKKK
ncbi:hypothetical protein ACFL2Y_00495 [Candidatus Omnitrophota bacterium]